MNSEFEVISTHKNNSPVGGGSVGAENTKKKLNSLLN